MKHLSEAKLQQLAAARAKAVESRQRKMHMRLQHELAALEARLPPAEEAHRPTRARPCDRNIFAYGNGNGNKGAHCQEITIG